MALWKAFTNKDYREVLQAITDDDNDFPLSEVEGQCPQEAVHTFSNLKDYLCTLGLCAKIEQELSSRDQSNTFRTKMLTLKTPPGNNKLTVLIDVPVNYVCSICTGDKAKAFLKVGKHLEKEHWDMKFVESFSSSPPEVMMATLQIPPKGNSNTKDSRSIPSTISWPAGDDTAKRISDIMKQEGTQCKIQMIPRHDIFPYVFGAFEEIAKMNHQLISQFLVDPLKTLKNPNVPKYDIYATIQDRTCVSEDKFELNDSQMAALRQARAAPVGFLPVHGGPGTGKTHFATQIIKPFFLDTEKRHRVLATSASNRGADAMAASLDNELKQLMTKLPALKNAYILRLYSRQTERTVFMREVRAARRRNLDKKSESPAELATQDSSQVTDAVTAHIHTYVKDRYEGVDDERVRNIELSLGTRMKQIAGIRPIKPDEEFPVVKGDSRKYRFLNLYYRYGNGEDFNATDELEFEATIETLMAITMNGATAICATVAGAADILVTRSYNQAELIVVDEAARVPEHESWPLITSFPHASCKILLGDPDQLQPHVGKSRNRNPLVSQLSLSLQSRLQFLGFPSAFFTPQYRAVPEIAAIYSNAGYQGRLKSDKSTHLEHRPLAQNLRCFNKEKYGIEQNVVFFDIPAKEEIHPIRQSRYCDDSIHCVMVVLEALLTAKLGSPKIAIITPYKEQEKKLGCAIALMKEKKYPQAAGVSLETVDRIQGMEYDVVIVDPVATSPSFLDKNRLNVLFSRARCGLYVVGNGAAWEDMFGDRSLPLRMIARQLAPFQKKWLPGHAPVSDFHTPDKPAGGALNMMGQMAKMRTRSRYDAF